MGYPYHCFCLSAFWGPCQELMLAEKQEQSDKEFKMKKEEAARKKAAEKKMKEIEKAKKKAEKERQKKLEEMKTAAEKADT